LQILFDVGTKFGLEQFMITIDNVNDLRNQNISEAGEIGKELSQLDSQSSENGRERLLRVRATELHWIIEFLTEFFVFLEKHPSPNSPKAFLMPYINKIAKDDRDSCLSDLAKELIEV
jgi:hypothetical protein